MSNTYEADLLAVLGRIAAGLDEHNRRERKRDERATKAAQITGDLSRDAMNTMKHHLETLGHMDAAALKDMAEKCEAILRIRSVLSGSA